MRGKYLMIMLMVLNVAGSGGCGQGRTDVLAGSGSRLAPCPGSPNCVSSLEEPGRSWVAPFLFRGRPEKAMDSLRECLAAEAGVAIVDEEKLYLHATFTSPLFGFVDDVEFSLSLEMLQIEVRSASRLGWWDFGANRRRVERLRRCFAEEESGE